jgi:hypothetical protein
MGILSQMISEPDADFRCEVCAGAQYDRPLHYDFSSPVT